jgi:uncharacterized membrane protein
MYSRVKLLGRPLHPMLVAFPITCYAATLLAFILHGALGTMLWFRIGLVANWLGVATALIAGAVGLVDWATGIPKGSTAKATGRHHMILQGLALAMFLVNGLVQLGYWGIVRPGADSAIPLVVVGLAFAVPGVFLGYTLVQRHHVGVTLRPGQRELEPLSEALPYEEPERSPPPLARPGRV